MTLNKIIKYSPYLSLLGLLIIFKPETFIMFGKIAFVGLLIIMLSRPLRDIFPKIKVLNKIVSHRKELGIIVGCFAIAHSIGYFFDTKAPFLILLNSNIWSIDSFMAWGFVAFIVAIPLTLTSNIFSMIKMGGKNWKRLQYLAYVMFIATIIHIALINPSKTIPMSIITILYIGILIYSFYLNKIKK
ncbi:MAG: ferric reductase-like transmembrane domain-containing protein [Candidatus Gracilibacteria bacterium]